MIGVGTNFFEGRLLADKLERADPGVARPHSDWRPPWFGDRQTSTPGVMLRAVTARCRNLASAGCDAHRVSPRWMTPHRHNGFVASAHERSSFRFSTAVDGGVASNTTKPSPKPPSPTPASLRPAILVCTSKVVNKETRGDYEAWLVDGKRLIEEVLFDKDCQAGLRDRDASAEVNVQSRFSWVHFPAPSASDADANANFNAIAPNAQHQTETGDEPSSHRHKRLTRAGTGASVSHVQHRGAPACETVAVVFQVRTVLGLSQIPPTVVAHTRLTLSFIYRKRHDDLERWRHSNRRQAWLKRGERFGDDGTHGVTSRATSIDTDDGSLGGWLPADANANSLKSESKTSPEAWKIYLTVLLAQYPLVEFNALFLLPAIEVVDVGGVFFGTAPQPLRLLLIQTWTSFAAVFATLPLAQWGLRKGKYFPPNTFRLPDCPYETETFGFYRIRRVP
jgi:hypothetical protein